MYRRFGKRLIDFIISFCGIIVLLIPMAIIAVIIKLDSKGPALFKQKRTGIHQTIFTVYKFRTMSTRRYDEDGRELSDLERITAVGRLLRKTSVDELPQLFNIIKGDMSLVGPRPLLIQYLPLYSEKQRRRHDVRPGLSGYAQVNGRNSITWTHKFELDCEYVRRITFVGDIKILFQTVVKAFIKQEGISSATSDTMEDFDGTN